ncbi:MAG: hypothetical protein ACR2JC_11955 [Chloroflexota bacterium]
MDLDQALALKRELSEWNVSHDQFDEIRVVTYDGKVFWVEAFEADDWTQYQIAFANRDSFTRTVTAPGNSTVQDVTKTSAHLLQ